MAPFGTGATIWELLQLAGIAGIPPNVTVLVPCTAPKFDPVIVITVPTEPDVGDKLLMIGPSTTVKTIPLLATPPTVTITFPVVAVEGTHAPMLLALQLVGVAANPLKVTVLEP